MKKNNNKLPKNDDKSSTISPEVSKEQSSVSDDNSNFGKSSNDNENTNIPKSDGSTVPSDNADNISSDVKKILTEAEDSEYSFDENERKIRS